MLINTKELKEITNKILLAVDSSSNDSITDTLEIVTKEESLYINVTNREYYVSVRLATGYSDSFHATIPANVFLKLVNQITTEDVELSYNENDNFLKVRANGNYKIPLIFEDNTMLSLPRITIGNTTVDMDISGSVLQSILKYNSKELQKGIVSHISQKYYYMDEHGALTFNDYGACANYFELPKAVKILLTPRVVKLFKLFNSEHVHFCLGYDEAANGNIRTKIQLESADVILTAILPGDESIITSIPVDAIRSRSTNSYPYAATVNKNELLSAINRILLLATGGVRSGTSPVGDISFNENGMLIRDITGANTEEVKFVGAYSPFNYDARLDLIDMKTTLETLEDQFLTIRFGDQTAVVFSKERLDIIISECSEA